MTNLENRLDRASSGEYRLNPDEQKLYLNTFRERIFLAITFDDAKTPQVKTAFERILSHFDMTEQPIFFNIFENKLKNCSTTCCLMFNTRVV